MSELSDLYITKVYKNSSLYEKNTYRIRFESMNELEYEVIQLKDYQIEDIYKKYLELKEKREVSQEMKKFKEIIIVVPEDKFDKIPEKVDYTRLPFGRIEKAQRLLIRSLRSAIDNKDNSIKFKELRSVYNEKRQKSNTIRNKLVSLHKELNNLKSTAKKYNLKIEGCSTITQEIKELESKLEPMEAEEQAIKQQIPNDMVKSWYWW